MHISPEKTYICWLMLPFCGLAFFISWKTACVDMTLCISTMNDWSERRSAVIVDRQIIGLGPGVTHLFIHMQKPTYMSYFHSIQLHLRPSSLFHLFLVTCLKSVDMPGLHSQKNWITYSHSILLRPLAPAQRHIITRHHFYLFYSTARCIKGTTIPQQFQLCEWD